METYDHTKDNFDGNPVIRICVRHFQQYAPEATGGGRLPRVRKHIFETKAAAQAHHDDILHESALLVDWLTQEQWDRRQFERKRQEMENIATEIMAQDHISRIDTEAFLDSLQDRISGESMEEDNKLPRNFALSPRQWMCDYSYSQKQASKYKRLLRWMEKQYPMLVSRWRNKKSQVEVRFFEGYANILVNGKMKQPVKKKTEWTQAEFEKQVRDVARRYGDILIEHTRTSE